MTREEFIQTIGVEGLEIFDAIIRTGFTEYFTQYTEVLYKHTPRTRASIIHDHSVDSAKAQFIDDPLVQVIEKDARILFDFNQKLLVNFKKLDEKLKSSNYPTQSAMKFINQMDMAGIPAELPRVTLGYVPKTDFSQILGTYAVKYGCDSEVEWSIDIISELDQRGEADQESSYGT